MALGDAYLSVSDYRGRSGRDVSGSDDAILSVGGAGLTEQDSRFKIRGS